MVLESLINPIGAEKRPWQMFFLGILYSSVAVVLSLWIFREHASLLMVFLTVFATMPIIYNTIKLEEKKDECTDDEPTLMKEHAKALEVFMFLFLGITLSMTFWYVFLPSGTGAGLFSAQIDTINNINSPAATGSFAKLDYFSRVFFNNTKVLMFCILFSFVYGLGAIFILTWNASVIAAAIGNYIRSQLSLVAQEIGMVSAGKYLHVYSCGFIFKYMPHGFLEILAYFTAGLAGGIISVAIIRHTLGTKKFSNVLLDSADLILVSVFILLIAGIVEAFVTPGLVSSMACG